jgi:Tol biopolymer transport system component
MMWLRTVVIGLLIVATSLSAATAQSLIRKLLRIAGITAGGAVRGPADEVVVPGNIWIADTTGGTRQPLTNSGGYRTPVFSPDGTVFALKGDDVVRFSSGGEETRVGTLEGAAKLAGFDGDSSTDLVVLRDEGTSPLAVLSVTSGKITPVAHDPTSSDDKSLVSSIRRQGRTYGDTVVYLRRESKAGAARLTEWTDVYVRRGAEQPRNVSACDGVSCAQPALSPDGRRLAFVKVATTP